MAAMGTAAVFHPTMSWGNAVRTQRQLWVTNAYGDDVHVFEVGSWKLIRHFVVGQNPHGISATADGRIVHISIENISAGDGELVWIDAPTGKITHRLPLGNRPNEHECTPDGKWIYVPCRTEGAWWVVDGEKKKVITKIQTGGLPHNTLVSSDGHRMYLSPQGDPAKVFIADVSKGHQIIGEIPFGDVPRPCAISPDEKYLFQNINGLLGFEAADIQSRKVIARVRHRPLTDPANDDERSHGICVRPDGKEVWSSIMCDGMVYVHTMGNDTFPEIARIKMPGQVYWIMIGPDSEFAYVSVPTVNQVAVLDCHTKEIVKLLDCGNFPKRTHVLDVPLP
jgi:DNA-binding beta-propeller fold protein YncE